MLQKIIPVLCIRVYNSLKWIYKAFFMIAHGLSWKFQELLVIFVLKCVNLLFLFCFFITDMFVKLGLYARKTAPQMWLEPFSFGVKSYISTKINNNIRVYYWCHYLLEKLFENVQFSTFQTAEDPWNFQ